MDMDQGVQEHSEDLVIWTYEYGHLMIWIRESRSTLRRYG